VIATAIALKISLDDFRQWRCEFQANDPAKQESDAISSTHPFTPDVDEGVVFVPDSQRLQAETDDCRVVRLVLNTSRLVLALKIQADNRDFTTMSTP